MSAPYKRFPPRTGHMLIPVGTRKAALAGLALYAPTRWTGVLIQRAATAAVWVAGPRALPFGTAQGHPGFMDVSTWQSLHHEWEQHLGAFDEMAVYRPPDLKRIGMAVLLLRSGSPRAFVKLRPIAESRLLTNEEQVLGLLAAHRPTTFSAGQVLVSGELDDWRYLAIEPLDGRIHRVPRNPPLLSVVEEIQAALAELPRTPGTPGHWLPIHGDLAPWNLRETSRGNLVLFDWEAAAWAPPGSDLVMYLSTAAAVGAGRPRSPGIGGAELREARAFWRAYWRKRVDASAPTRPNRRRLAVQVLKVLDAADRL